MGWGGRAGQGPWDARTCTEEAISSSGKPADEHTLAPWRWARGGLDQPFCSLLVWLIGPLLRTDKQHIPL